MKRLITLQLSIFFLTTSLYTIDSSHTGFDANTRIQLLLTKYHSQRDTQIKAESEKYIDMADHYAALPIACMSLLGVIAGYSDGRFGPNDTLLACQYLTMVIHALGFNPETLPGQEYWRGCVDKAIELKIVSEGEITNYIEPLTRELAAVIAFRTLMLYEARPKEGEIYFEYNVSKISDFQIINDQYKNDVVMSYRTGLITGSDNLFVPQGTLTRAQGCIIVNKLIDKNLREESIPQPYEIVAFKNRDCNEYLFYPAEMYPNRIYLFQPGTFPLNEIFEVVKTLINHKDKVSGGYIVQGYYEDTQNFYTELYKDKDLADQFYFRDPRFPTASAKFSIRTEKVYTKGGLTSKGSGFLYSLNVWDCITYNNYMKEYTYEIIKTLFEKDADKAIELHNKYLSIPMEGLQGTFETTTLNERYMSIGGGRTGFYIEIYAKGAIK